MLIHHNVASNVLTARAPADRGRVITRFTKIFSGRTPALVGMAHVPPLPGTPLHDRENGMTGAVDAVRRDVEILRAEGLDGVLFCNEGDRPYQLTAGLESAAAMARVVTECAPADLPYGVDFLWDHRCAVAVAAVSDAAFVRTVATGVWESDMGLWTTDAAHVLRERARLGRDDMGVFMNVTPEFASPIGSRSVVESARSVAVSSLPDAVLVSGPMAGAEPSVSLVEQIREVVPEEIPVLLNTGARASTIASYLPFISGCIVGTELKVDRYTWNPVCPERTRRFVDAVRSAR